MGTRRTVYARRLLATLVMLHAKDPPRLELGVLTQSVVVSWTAINLRLTRLETCQAIAHFGWTPTTRFRQTRSSRLSATCTGQDVAGKLSLRAGARRAVAGNMVRTEGLCRVTTAGSGRGRQAGGGRPYRVWTSAHQSAYHRTLRVLSPRHPVSRSDPCFSFGPGRRRRDLTCQATAFASVRASRDSTSR